MSTDLVLLAIASFISQFVFTWASRSRMSGSPMYHFRASLVSNVLFVLVQVLVIKSVLSTSTLGNDIPYLLLVSVIYGVSSAFGGSCGLSFFLQREKGDKRIGFYREG